MPGAPFCAGRLTSSRVQVYKSYAALPVTGSGTSGAQRCVTLAHQGQKRPKAARVSVLTGCILAQERLLVCQQSIRYEREQSGVDHLAALVSGLDQHCRIVSGLLFRGHIRRSCIANPLAGCCSALPVGKSFTGIQGPPASTTGPARLLASFLQNTPGATGQPCTAAGVGSDLR